MAAVNPGFAPAEQLARDINKGDLQGGRVKAKSLRLQLSMHRESHARAYPNEKKPGAATITAAQVVSIRVVQGGREFRGCCVHEPNDNDSHTLAALAGEPCEPLTSAERDALEHDFQAALSKLLVVTTKPSK